MATTTDQSDQRQPCSFLHLLFELRTIIYSHVLDSIYTTKISQRALLQRRLDGPSLQYGSLRCTSLRSGRLNILQTCRSISAEAKEHLYHKQLFRFFLTSSPLPHFKNRPNANLIQNIEVTLDLSDTNTLPRTAAHKEFLRFVAKAPRNTCRIILTRYMNGMIGFALCYIVDVLMDLKTIIIETHAFNTDGFGTVLKVV